MLFYDYGSPLNKTNRDCWRTLIICLLAFMDKLCMLQSARLKEDQLYVSGCKSKTQVRVYNGKSFEYEFCFCMCSVNIPAQFVDYLQKPMHEWAFKLVTALLRDISENLSFSMSMRHYMITRIRWVSPCLWGWY